MAIVNLEYFAQPVTTSHFDNAGLLDSGYTVCSSQDEHQPRVSRHATLQEKAGALADLGRIGVQGNKTLSYVNSVVLS